MAIYDFKAIEAKWQARWKENNQYHTDVWADKPKFYILDMFPYPSGAGLHVGHPLGYISTSIFANYMRLKGYSVLRPMGFDSFGLPAENYAIQTGQHPAVTTQQNVSRYLTQLDMLGLGYDPATCFCTSDPNYYRWTQWIFLQLFDSWYDQEADKARPMADLVAIFEQQGNIGLQAATQYTESFSNTEWQAFSEREKQLILLQYRLAYTDNTYVNWCEALGTVLANEEVKDGLSERGGHPVERKLMRQWLLRITAYSERLLAGLDKVEWSAALVEMQKNWIGKSSGALVDFKIAEAAAQQPITVFTTRPDTLYGVSFLVLAPEHPIVSSLTTPEQQAEVESYIQYAAHRSERDRQAEVKHYTGAFTGSYATHPLTQAPIPIWIADYVLVGYGTGAIMAVPGHDKRDHAFATTFGLPIIQVIEGPDVQESANESKEGNLINSPLIDGLAVPAAIEQMIQHLEQTCIGQAKISYRFRDAIFSRQRYWGEPFPIEWDGDVPYAVSEVQLPVTLPQVERYSASGTGASPLAVLSDWVNMPNGRQRETDTMPGWAGSSWYFLRYIDPENTTTFADAQLLAKWMPVDLYVGGTEHAVGHLLYSRFWTKFLFDRGFIRFDEPFQKLVNQGMIQGVSAIAYREKTSNTFVSLPLPNPSSQYTPIHIDVNLAPGHVLDVTLFKQWRAEFADASFILNVDGQFICEAVVEKMSKSLHNVVNPDEVCAQHGVDTFRMYEMFLGPIEQSKPWSTQGISGVSGFLRRTCSLFFDEADQWAVVNETPTSDELKILHKTIKKVEEDIPALSFNTSVSQFMICVNELTKLKCRKRAILEPLVIILSPFAPHLCEELWEQLGHKASVLQASFPTFNPDYLVESSFEYPISINGKLRAKQTFDLQTPTDEMERLVLDLADVQKHIQGQKVKKIIVVSGKIINIVV
jgi:leucyl-tRNA synthetase